MYDIISVGSATVDVFAHTKSELITIKTQDLEEELIAYPSGSKILVKSLRFATGGGGTNTAVAFSRLGLKTAYLGNIGHDDNGKKVLDVLKKEGVDFIGTISEDTTNYSIILDSIEEDRTILVYKDASEKLDFGKISKDSLLTQWFYLCSLDTKVLEKITSYAHKKGIKIAFNPSSYLAKKGKDSLKKVLRKTDILILNDEEAAILTGRAPVPILLDRLSRLGPRIVIITQGPRGADVLHSDTIYHAEALKVKVVETTGAGDAFGASFLAGLMLKNSIEFALKLAIINSASVVSHMGPKTGLLTEREAEIVIKKAKIKVKTVNLKK